jgi:hypothetical protein
MGTSGNKCATSSIGDVDLYALIRELRDYIFNILPVFMSRREIQTQLQMTFFSVCLPTQGMMQLVEYVDSIFLTYFSYNSTKDITGCFAQDSHMLPHKLLFCKMALTSLGILGFGPWIITFLWFIFIRKYRLQSRINRGAVRKLLQGYEIPSL